jgi:cytochrome d ubiquinol oxidase subunit I
MNIFLAMSQLTAARAQMTLSLVFHIIFAATGIGLPLLMVIAEFGYLRTGHAHLLALTKKWAKATGLLFAVGAVSGTALSFELGLLWPRYIEITGAAVGHLFGLEGFAFFIEAIFIGLYLYGWDRLSPWAHWWCGATIAFSGAISGVLVLGVNAWMQLPVGIVMDAAGRVIGTQPLGIFKTYAWWTMALHSTLSSYISVGFAAAAIYAGGYLKGRRDDYHQSGIRIGLAVGGICAVLQMLSGDLIAKFVYANEPAKFAAMEAHFETSAYAPVVLGGLPDIRTRTVHDGIKVPGALSFLATHHPSSVVTGLDDIPQDQWPNIPIVHLAFDVMVGCGSVLALLAIVFGWLAWRRGALVYDQRWLIRLIALAGGLGFVALEAGWTVTEAGRQPWAIHGILRTAQSVTPSTNVVPMFWAYAGLYAILTVTSIVLLRYISIGNEPVITTQPQREG